MDFYSLAGELILIHLAMREIGKSIVNLEEIAYDEGRLLPYLGKLSWLWVPIDAYQRRH